MPTLLSSSRVIFSSIFYVLTVYFFNTVAVWLVFVFFALIEISDMLDGWVARKLFVVSNFGKLFDPICDVSAHFLCLFALQQVGIMPSLVLTVFVFREIWVAFIRSVLLLKQNHTLASQFSGKLKTWFYGVSIFVSIFMFPQSMWYETRELFIQPMVTTLFYASGFLSVFSGLQYVIQMCKIFFSRYSK